MKSPKSDTRPRLDSNDRMMIGLIGLVVFIIFAALSNITIPIAACVGLVFFGLIQFYGLMPRTDEAAIANKKAKEVASANMFGEKAISEGLSDGMWIINPIGQIIYGNSAASNIWPDVKIGQRYNAHIRSTPIQKAIEQTLAGKNVDPLAHHMESPTDRHMQIYFKPLQPAQESNPKFRHALIVFHDETALLKSNIMRGDFLANASHELKTPIASLLGYIETLRGHAKNDPAAQEKFLGIMQEQAERMQRLINDLLSLRQIEQVEHLAPKDKVDLSKAIKQALDAVTPMAKKRDVSLKVPELKPIWVTGNSDELTQLCVNIIDNAIKMSPPKSVINLEAKDIPCWRPHHLSLANETGAKARTRLLVPPLDADCPYAALTISDDGPGFTKEHLPRIGERFYRVAGDRSSRDKGTGLGLAIVKHIILRHRAGLYVKTLNAADILPEDNARTGTSFTAFIPMALD